MKRWKLLVWLALGAVAAMPACGSSENCVINEDCPGGQVCVRGHCEAAPGNAGSGDAEDGSGAGGAMDAGGTSADAGGAQPDAGGTPTGTDAAAHDATATAPDAGADSGAAPPDTATPDAGPAHDVSTPEPDVLVDTEPPTISSSSPADGQTDVALPVEIAITFNEPIRKQLVQKTVFYVLDPLTNKKIPHLEGSPALSADGLTVTIKPDASKMASGSPYEIHVQSVVQDLAGNKMNDDPLYEWVSTFYTAPASLDSYVAIAAQFAPRAYVSVREDSPQVDYPTRFDFDGDLAPKDNPDAINKAKEVPAAVYWDVMETKTHYFLVYTYLWPFRPSPGGTTKPIANDTAGVIVVVAKNDGNPVPVEALTYGRLGSSEDLGAWVADESNLAGSNLVDGHAPRDELFPGGHFEVYLTSPDHQACSWKFGGVGKKCELNEGIKATLHLVEYGGAAAQPTVFEKAGGNWPLDLQGADAAVFELVSTLGSLWIRRQLVGSDLLWDNDFTYEPDPGYGRPGAGLPPIPKTFGHPSVNDLGGYPPWAWQWKPSGFATQYTKVSRGTIFLDPAWFLAKRHLTNPANAPAWWSLDYCLEPYLGIDLRGQDPACSPAP